MSRDPSYLLGQSELSEQVMKALELKGDLPQSIDSGFGLGITVADLTRPEYSRLRRENLIIGGDAVAATVGELPLSGLIPASTGNRSVIAVVEQLIISNLHSAAVRFLIGFGQSTFIASNLGMFRDDRMRNLAPGGVGSLGSFGVRSQTAVSSPVSVSAGATPSIVLLPNTSMVLTIPFVLTGQPLDTGGPAGVFAVGLTTNAPAAFTWVWRERLLLASEIA